MNKFFNKKLVVVLVLIVSLIASILYSLYSHRLRKEGAPLAGVKNHLILGIDLLRVRHYYLFMCNKSGLQEKRKTSLAVFLQKLFTEVSERSGRGEARQENRDAIFAMIMLLGSNRFGKFNSYIVGDMGSTCMRRFRNVVLAGRSDLRKHFVYSAALKLMTEKTVSYAIGEFKEFFDIVKHRPTGFSFIDIAANIAGLRFAETVVETEAGARWAQHILAKNTLESVFFPITADLKEGFSDSEFHRLYHDTHSQEYRAVLEDLLSRINNLPLHNRIPLLTN